MMRRFELFRRVRGFVPGELGNRCSIQLSYMGKTSFPIVTRGSRQALSPRSEKRREMMQASRRVARIEATAHLKARISVNAGEENQSAMKGAGAVRLVSKEATIDTLYHIIETTMKED